MTRRALEEFAARRLSNVPKTTVWSEMTPLALEYKAVNLGQGFPTFHPPDFVMKHVASVVTDEAAPLNHQYCRMFGHFELVNPLRSIYAKRLQRDIQPMELMVTNGVTQGLNLCCQAFLQSGDECVVFEPYFDLYGNDIEMAGATVQLIPMVPSTTHANEWKFSEELLRSKITSKTKAILLNNPQNVPGKVWSLEELKVVAAVAQEHDLLVFADEVYMSLVYDGLEHVSIASLPGMFERTITMCSAGKTFSCTGYKIGWVVAPEAFIIPLSQVQAHQSFSIATPLQIAVGRSLVDAETCGYYEKLVSTYSAKRGALVKALTDAGLQVVMPAGGYFALADISRVDESHYVDPKETSVGRDWQFCRWMTKVIGVNAIPTTAFCSPESRPQLEKFVRFAFCKKDEDIAEAGVRLQKLQAYFKSQP